MGEESDKFPSKSTRVTIPSSVGLHPQASSGYPFPQRKVYQKQRFQDSALCRQISMGPKSDSTRIAKKQHGSPNILTTAAGMSRTSPNCKNICTNYKRTKPLATQKTEFRSLGGLPPPRPPGLGGCRPPNPLCFALHGFALLCIALLCFAFICFALLCFALLCFALLC